MQNVEKVLHMYSQSQPHGEAYIVGDVNALMALRDSIDRAIATGYGSTSGVYSQDGEGYPVVVIKSNRHDLLLPYTDTDFRVKGGVHPHRLLTPEIYRKLVTEGEGVK